MAEQSRSGYLSGVTGETFDAARYLLSLPPRVRAILAGEQGDARQRRAVRIALTRHDPLLFAMIYFRDHLRRDRDGGLGAVTMSDFHLDICRHARAELDGEAPELRNVRVAPRESGKSTWHFLLLPMFRGAHGHTHFEAAFSDTPGQAEQHLQTMRLEMDENTLLQNDFPQFCRAKRRSSGTTVADNMRMIHTGSGWTFAARGVLGGVLGLKSGRHRPDRLILDDIEPSEENYSAYQAEQRLKTLTESIFPLGWNARIDMVGTVTMPESIIHQCVQHARGEHKTGNAWVSDERLHVRHYGPFVEMPDGRRRSSWPGKWSLSDLERMEHTRAFAKNYLNDPLATDGAYWTQDDIHYGDVDGPTRVVMFIDPAIKKKKTSDRTGIAVWAQSRRSQSDTLDAAMLSLRGQASAPAPLALRYASGVRETGEGLRAVVLRVLEQHPDVERVIIEDTQGGSTWHSVFHNMPVPVVTVNSADVWPGSKEVRMAKALAHYQTRPVSITHAGRFVDAEGEMVAYPNGLHDDVADAVAMGVLIFRERPRAPRAGNVRSFLS